MFGDIVPRGSSIKISIRPATVWARTLAADLNTSAPAPATAIWRMNSLRFIGYSLPDRPPRVNLLWKCIPFFPEGEPRGTMFELQDANSPGPRGIIFFQLCRRGV